jgi:putative phosphoesterase
MFARKLTGTIRVAILSDTHGFLDSRVAEVVLSCDVAVHAGDIGCAAILRELLPRKKLVIAVRGNNDTVEKWPPKEAGVVRGLPLETSLALPGGKLVVTHGHTAGTPKRRHTRLRTTHSAARAIVYGHSHRLICDQEQIPWVLNPGSAGRSRTFGGPSCLLLVASPKQWRVQPFRFAERPRR